MFSRSFEEGEDEDCQIDDEVKLFYQNFKNFLAVKQYDDGYSQRIDQPICRVPTLNLTNQCLCDCHKMDKVAIYDVYYVLELLHKNVNIKRFGDVFTYYYNNQVDSVFNFYNISDDILSLERDVMKELG